MGKLNIDISQLSIFEVLISGFSAAAIAETTTLPLDTVKVQMQVYQGKFANSRSCISSIVKSEGFRGLFKGFQGGMMRQLFFGTTRLGIFDYFNGYLQRTKGPENITLIDRIILGVSAGGIAMTIANPTDVIKIRFQSDSRMNPRYKNFFDAGVKIYKSEGFAGFYQSLPINVFRNSLVCGCELATYDQTKMQILKEGLMEDNLTLHVFSSAVAGFLATVISSPVDVVKSNYMNGKLCPIEGKRILYNNVFEAAKWVAFEGGFKGFYKGFNANCQRIISWNIIMFVLREKFLLYFYQKKVF